MRHRRLIKILIPMSVMVLAIMLATTFSCAISAQNAEGYVNSSCGVIMRAKASTLSNKIALLNDNTKVEISKEVFTSKTSTKKTTVWYYVKAGSKKGYIRSDLVDNITYTAVNAKITGTVNYRVGPGTKMTRKGSLKKGKAVVVYLKATPVSSTKGSSATWYKIKVGSSYRYVCSAYVKILSLVEDKEETNPKESKPDSKDNTDDFEAYLTTQGFPETYKVKLRELHTAHPNWEFSAYKTNVKWADALKAENKNSLNQIYSKGKWVNADVNTLAYYLDPRNFLNENRIFMFEQLSYNSSYQTIEVVQSVLKPSDLPGYGFKADIFVAAGSKYNISPIHLASRARLENGSGKSKCVSGTVYQDKVVYNPFNIRATGADPVQSALKYAYQQGWTSPEIAIDAGAKCLAKEYINAGQDTLYIQKFYIKNTSHQYMQNVQAPYNEAYMTKKAYEEYGITEKNLSFVIPIYVDMPDTTELPS